MTDTNTSGADVLAALDDILGADANGCRNAGISPTRRLSLQKARASFAALIERNAELEASVRNTEFGKAAEKLADDYLRLNSEHAGLIAERDALAAEVEVLREACKPLALMAPHYPTVRTFGNRPRTGEIHTVESPKYGVASIKVEDLWRAHDLLCRASAATGGGNG